MKNYIKRHVNIPEDYKCDSCQNENKNIKGRVQRNVLQVYSLARLSEVIILVFNKYDHKRMKYFPQALDFKGVNGTLHYEVVSQIEHSGGRNGGHYWTKCRRPKPPGLVEHLQTNTLASIKKRMETIVNS